MLEKLVTMLPGMKTRVVTGVIASLIGILVGAGQMSEGMGVVINQFFADNWAWISLAIPAVYQLIREVTYKPGAIAKKVDASNT